ncbi:hypothetical protein VPH35_076360 [Triticum aestivum]
MAPASTRLATSSAGWRWAPTCRRGTSWCCRRRWRAPSTWCVGRTEERAVGSLQHDMKLAAAAVFGTVHARSWGGGRVGDRIEHRRARVRRARRGGRVSSGTALRWRARRREQLRRSSALRASERARLWTCCTQNAQ